MGGRNVQSHSRIHVLFLDSDMHGLADGTHDHRLSLHVIYDLELLDVRLQSLYRPHDSSRVRHSRTLSSGNRRKYLNCHFQSQFDSTRNRSDHSRDLHRGDRCYFHLSHQRASENLLVFSHCVDVCFFADDIQSRKLSLLIRSR